MLAEVTKAISEGKPLVLRSEVGAVSDYREYKQILRYDFIYSCAYCSLTEAEALGIRFTIDHYEPQSARPDLVATYSNLMYCCGECNLRKSDLTPPESAREAGFRFFRPDEDWFGDHFDAKFISGEHHLTGKSPVGTFSIEYLDLNRQWLLKLRRIRRELLECVAFTGHGVNALRTFPIDRLPPAIKGKAREAISRSIAAIELVEDRVDDLLREIAASPLLDEDEGAAKREKERAQALRRHEALYPGAWRGRRLRGQPTN